MSDYTDGKYPSWWWSKSRKDAYWAESRVAQIKRQDDYFERVARMREEDPLERLKRYAELCPPGYAGMAMGKAEDLLKHMIGYRTYAGDWPRDIDWIINEIERLRANCGDDVRPDR